MPASNWKILVVEDEFDSIRMVSKILRHHGAEVAIAKDGHECLAILEDVAPHLIMMDLALPELDGWQTLEQVRANPKTAHIPVVAMTAYHSVSVEEDAVIAGFDAYFSKPLETGTIVGLLAEIINK